MITNKIVLGVIGALVLVAVGAGVYITKMDKAPSDDYDGPVVCTLEAKLCPDGSSVGRGGPNCEFAPCPAAPVTPPVVKASTTARLGERVSNNGVFITPLQVIEDSRCPVDPKIACLVAGRVVVNTRLERNGKTDQMLFDSFKSDLVTFEGKTVALVAVSPEKGSVSATNNYVFTFKVNNSTSPVPVACTTEAKLCPDGSAVGRTGPNCAFAPCPPIEVLCTADAKLCPDGSYVGRAGPRCEFVPCPGSLQVTCTTDVKLCPNGSYVRRSAPSCDFDTCPPSI